MDERYRRFLEKVYRRNNAAYGPGAIEEEARQLAGQPAIAPQASELERDIANAEQWQETVGVPSSPAQYGQAKVFDGTNTPLQSFLQAYSPIPCLWRVTVGLELPPQISDPPVTVDQGRSFALVTFGAGEAKHQVAIDWGRGQSITVPGVFVQVAGQLLVESAPAFNEEPITMYATAVPHANASPTRPCYRTVNVGTVNTGATTGTFIIPPFASRLQVMSNQSQPNWTVLFIGDGGANTVAQRVYTAASSRNLYNFGESIPIPASASGVALTNNAGGNAGLTKMVFELQL